MSETIGKIKGDGDIEQCFDLARVLADFQPVPNYYGQIQRESVAAEEFVPPPDDADSVGEENDVVPASVAPRWNGDLKELTTPSGDVRKYAGQAKNCHAVLEEFERNDWPTRIDDPLPFRSAVNPTKRVEETCQTLNASLTGMRFRVADGGKSFIWEKLENSG